MRTVDELGIMPTARSLRIRVAGRFRVLMLSRSAASATSRRAVMPASDQDAISAVSQRSRGTGDSR